MPIFRLSEQIDFPPARLSRSDGLLCIGGDLAPERLVLAYKRGIFPWFSENEPILWWSPDPRLVLFPQDIKISRSLRKTINKNCFQITVDNDFESTIRFCARPRRQENEGTWLVREMIQAYIRLHRLGIAHSVEAWSRDRLVGGLYGIHLGKAFFGESMFSLENDASKVALVALANHLRIHGFHFIDCQVTSEHLINMGGVEISRHAFLNLLSKSVREEADPELWNPHVFLDPIPLEKNPESIR
ncbi:leucyl/phenylalanyl-tRNA--protein transferase [Desulfospira joergensenii]|uniref:leucyl/phenylalanyl-tRNA--protein transferase n=1 Tax=Desulfospira joergensenii TaxID=53329 RepID=UPI0003B6D329|nr:leucyl/phenylalanyl-tRNA--protein transferase [Desulfospira joergensenii]